MTKLLNNYVASKRTYFDSKLTTITSGHNKRYKLHLLSDKTSPSGVHNGGGGDKNWFIFCDFRKKT